MDFTDRSSESQGGDNGTVDLQRKNIIAPTASDDRATTSPPAPTSSILYTLLQDLGLKATAQALCDELQQQRQPCTASRSPPSAASLPSHASEIFESLPTINGVSLPNSLGVLLSLPHTGDVSFPKAGDQTLTLSSVHPLPASADTSLTAPAAPHAVRVSRSANSACDVSVELQRRLQPHRNASQCTQIIASLAACAVEPLQALFAVSTSSSSSVPESTTVAPLQLVEMLTTLWQAERRAVAPACATPGTTDAAADSTEVHKPQDRGFQVAALVSRAAWCELRITELVFMQELYLAHTSCVGTVPSAAVRLLQEAQRELADVAGQLVAALQELRATCGAAGARCRGVGSSLQGVPDASSTHVGTAIASSIVSRLHSKSIGWLNNAECVMAWILRRHDAFEQVVVPPPTPSCPQQQQRKRRCLEADTTSATTAPLVAPAPNIAVSPLLQPLQDVILGLPNGTLGPAPSYQQCLDAEMARSATAAAAALAKSAATRNIEPKPATGACETNALFSLVRIPTTVRVAMTVQRVKLLPTLISALVFNGEDSILGLLEAAPTDHIRHWWSRQCAMMAQFLMQCAHQLIGLLKPFMAQSPTGVPTAPPSRPRTLTAASEAVLISLRNQLEALAKELLLSTCPVVSIPPSTPGGSRLAFFVRLMDALQQAQDSRLARLDWYVLKNCTTASAAVANAVLSASSPLSAVADVAFSPLSSDSGPTFASDGSPSTSPLWTLRVPSPPGTGLRGATEQPVSSTLAHRGSIGSDTSSISDSLEASRIAARVLQWKGHFTQLLATVATGRWHAKQDAPQPPYPGSRYHRLRMRMRNAMLHAQELLRLQPRPQVGARGLVYTHHPIIGSGSAAGAALSVVEQIPLTLQLATMENAHLLQKRLQIRLTKESNMNGLKSFRAKESHNGTAAAAATVTPPRGRYRASPSSVSQSRMSGPRASSSVGEYHSASSVLAVATATAHHLLDDATATVANGADGQASASPSLASSEETPGGHDATRSEAETRSSPLGVATSSTSDSPEPQWEIDDDENEDDVAETPQLVRWNLQGESEEEEADAEEVADAAEEEEEEAEEEEEEEVRSQASSADMDYERAEDGMKEEVECVETTPDGRLLALLTARGKLMVLRLQAHDSARRYEEEVIIDTTLPNMPSHGKRLQWYESLSSILCFSPCHRFIIASVQFAAIDAPPNTSLAMASAAKEATGQLNVYSLHRDSGHSEDTATDDRVDATTKKKKNVSSSSGSAHDRLHRLIGASTDRLYGTFRPHEGSCLSARWVDPRWWGGGRRSQWANSALEPLNSSKVAASMLAKPTETEETARSFVSFRENGSATEPVTIPPESWRAAAGVLLSEYQCVSVGMDDLILRWLPASGLVLQRILTEPVQDIIVSPLMAAFYVACDNGDLYMYDAWDERNVMDDNSCGSGDGVDSCNVCLTSPNTMQAHRLVLPVTEEGHPRFHRVGGPPQQKQQQLQQQQRSQRRDVADDPDTSDLVHSSRSYAHYSGPVTPVFQRIVDPSHGTLGLQQQMSFFAYHPYNSENVTTAECDFEDDDSDDDEHGSEPARSRPAGGRPAQGSSNRTESGQTKRGAGRVGWSGLPKNLRWLLPNQWAAHTPWDAQLGRRLIRNLLRQTDNTTSTDIGELFYERDEETAGVAATLAATNDDSHQPSLLDEQRNSAGAVSGVRDEEGGTSGGGRGGGQQDVSSNDEHSDFDSSEREYAYTNGADYDDDDDGARRPLPSKVINGYDSSYIASEATATAAAAAKGAPVSVLECAAHPTPARGPLQRAYYPSGACLVYKSVAKALCSAGDLADRQTHSEMGPGGPTHHLLYMTLSGEPQWMAERRLWDREAEEAGATQRGQCRYNQNGTTTDFDNAHREGQTQQLGGESEANVFFGSSAPPTLWSTAALARVLLWKDYFSTSRYLAAVKPQTWAEWESDVLATTYHADMLPPSDEHPAGTTREPRWSAAELLAARGYFGPRDAWRRCAPASQRGLAATARNGRYLCIMASVGPYRKLVNPREPLREIAGFYACLVFDVYAGAVLRVIPVCPTELTGLCGRNMWTSERHENDPKAPIYRLPCTVTVVPLNAQPVGPTAPGSGANMTLSSRARVGSNESPGGLRSHGNLPTLLQIDEAVVGDEEDGEPSEVVVLTVGGLGNSIFVFDALSGRRLVHETELTRHCAEAATAAYEVSNLAAKMRAKSRGARSDGAKPSGSASVPHTSATPVAAPAVVSSQLPFPSSMAPPAPPTSIRKSVDVLASVAGWGRGTGFGVIADRAASTAYATEMPAMRDADGRVGGESSSVVQPNHADTDEQTATAAAVLPVSGESAQSGVPVPWLLQGTAPTQLGGWHLRGILWWVHRNPQPSTLYGDDDGGATTNHNASWSLHSTAPSETNTHAGGGGLRGNDGTGAANNPRAAPSSPNFTTSVTSSALSFFYQTLLGVSAMTSTAATRRPHALSVAPSEPHASQRQADSSLSSALMAGTAGSLSHNAGTTSFSYASVWKQRRRRLLQRLLRHYDVAMLWQAYVTLFAASTTATGSLAPQSSVCALVQWALSTDKAATAATTFLGPTISHTPWTWCSTSACEGETRGTPTPPKQPHPSVCTGKQRVARRHDVEHSDTIDGGAGGNISTCNTVPFAHVLQQRDEFLFELQALDGHTQQATGGAATTASPARSTSRGQAKSLLSEIRAQASAEGIFPLTAKARTAQQQPETSGRESFSPAALKLPPAHHQNQLHVDAINCVATWIDANGGFYLCCGSEDGGLYIMGGNVMA